MCFEGGNPALIHPAPVAQLEEAEEFVHVYADAAAVAAGRLDEGLDGEVAG